MSSFYIGFILLADELVGPLCVVKFCELSLLEGLMLKCVCIRTFR